MKFRFRDIAGKRGKMHIHSACDVGEMVGERKDVTISEPVQVELSIEVESQGIARIQGQLTARMELQCSRCLTSFTQTYVIPFDERFKLKDLADLSAGEADDDVISVTDDCVHLKPYVEETLLMKVPYAPLCDEVCKGLCPLCGNNRNEHLCECLNERIDPRLAVLRDLFKK